MLLVPAFLIGRKIVASVFWQEIWSRLASGEATNELPNTHGRPWDGGAIGFDSPYAFQREAREWPLPEDKEGGRVSTRIPYGGVSRGHELFDVTKYLKQPQHIEP